MRKSDKKIENQIIKTLSQVCESGLEEIAGFEWLTHTVNFEQFPDSLKITCIFNNNKDLACYLNSTNSIDLKQVIEDSLQDIGIKIKNANKQIILDSEENCTLQHAGNWRQRLS